MSFLHHSLQFLTSARISSPAVRAVRSRARSSRCIALATALLVTLGAANCSAAATIFVNSFQSGTGNCSLVEAIYSANFHNNLAIDSTDPDHFVTTGCVPGDGNDTILLPPFAVFQLGTIVDDAHNPFGPTATPIIFSNITIEASGARLERVGNLKMRLFAVGAASVDLNPGGTPNIVSGTGSLTIRNAHIKGFVVKGGSGAEGGGGGMGAGGAIYVKDGVVVIDSSTFENNGAVGGNGSSNGPRVVGGGGGGLSGNGGSAGNGSTQMGGGGGGGSRGNGAIDTGFMTGYGGGGGGTVTNGGSPFFYSGGFNCGGGSCPGGGGSGGVGLGGGDSGGKGNYGGGGGGGGYAGSGGNDGGDGGFGGGGGSGTTYESNLTGIGPSGGNGGYGGGGGAANGGFISGGPGHGGSFGGKADQNYGGGGGALGGAIFNDGGGVRILNSTFTGNFVYRGDSGGVTAANGADAGGAIFSLNGHLTVVDSTISGNRSTGSGAGIVMFLMGSPSLAPLFILDNTIIANNSATECSIQGSGTVAASGAGNLIDQNDNCLGMTENADPQLGPLQFNFGGFTPTMAIPKNSLAWHTADPGTSLATDQRGQARPAMGGFDIGAFELCLDRFGMPCIIIQGIGPPPQFEPLTTKASPAAGGTVNPASGIFSINQDVTLTATPNPGYVFNSWTGAVHAPNNPITFVTMDAPHTVIANFTPLPTTMAGNIIAKAGPHNARTWTLSLLNNGPGGSYGVAVSSFTLVQTFGAACTPVVGTAFPLAVSDLAPAQTGTANLTIDFTGCAASARFTAKFTYSANGGPVSGNVMRYNQFQ
jgi:hypothetical protein